VLPYGSPDYKEFEAEVKKLTDQLASLALRIFPNQENNGLPRLSLLRLAAEERRHIQIVRRNFMAHLADVLLHLMNNV